MQGHACSGRSPSPICLVRFSYLLFIRMLRYSRECLSQNLQLELGFLGRETLHETVMQFLHTPREPFFNAVEKSGKGVLQLTTKYKLIGKRDPEGNAALLPFEARHHRAASVAKEKCQLLL